MPSIPAEDYHAEELADALAERGFTHLRVRRRGALLTIESGDKRDAFAHARLRRDGVHLWILEMPTHSATWERTPFRQHIDRQLELLCTELSWALAPRPAIPMRTSGRKY